jgi:hypothetical protein
MSASRPDPQQRLRSIRRGLADTPAHLAEGFARAVRSLPEERLEQLMRTPARRLVLDGIFWQLPKHFDSTRAGRMQTSVRWTITGRADGGADVYRLEIADGSARVIRGDDGSEARIRVTVGATEFLRLAAGASNPISAYFKGRITIAGDVMTAARLASLLAFPAANGAAAQEPAAQPA